MTKFYFAVFLIFISFLYSTETAEVDDEDVQKTFFEACNYGDLYKLKSTTETLLTSKLSAASRASVLHTLSNLALILDADTVAAVDLHLQAKSASPTVIPPLAAMHLKGDICGGLGDLYYVSAVSIKHLVDSRSESSQHVEAKITAHKTLLTLLSDSGLSDESERHLEAALQVFTIK